MTSGVVGQPSENRGYAAVQTGSHHEGHAVLNLGCCDVGDYRIANDGNREGEEHDDAADFEVVGYEGNDYGYHSCNGIWDDAPKLGLVGCEAEGGNDRR